MKDFVLSDEALKAEVRIDGKCSRDKKTTITVTALRVIHSAIMWQFAYKWCRHQEWKILEFDVKQQMTHWCDTYTGTK